MIVLPDGLTVTAEGYARMIGHPSDVRRLEEALRRWKERDPCPLVGAVNVPLPFDEEE